MKQVRIIMGTPITVEIVGSEAAQEADDCSVYCPACAAPETKITFSKKIS